MRKLFFLVFLLFVISVTVSSVSGFQSGTQVVVLSEYSHGDTLSSSHKRWFISTDAGEGGSTIVSFSSSGQSGTKSICVLSLSQDRKEIEWQANRSTQKKYSQSGLLLTHGFPAPANVFPLVFGEENPILYEERLTRGGREFVKKYQVETHKINTEQAKKKGYLKNDFLGEHSLQLIVVREGINGKQVALQLWSEDGEWWLYEETKFRRSWLIQN